MKNLIYILFVIAVILTSCENELVKEPDFIAESNIFEVKELTDAYMAKVYNAMPFMDLNESQTSMAVYSAVGMECIAFATWQQSNLAVNREYSQTTGAGQLDYWDYSNIRDVNFILENVVNSSTYNQDYIDQTVAEAKFLRAFMYFELVKRFGGVPLVTKVLDRDASAEEMFPPRNTEKEIYDFIYSELEEVIKMFSDDKTGAKGRADKYAALALESRAMLYAASIARNSTVQLDGVVGIPASEAQGYYQKSYNASKAIMESGKFSLFNKYPADPEKNYTQLFLEEANDEVIFAEVFEPVIRGHDFDYMATPQGYDAAWNANWPVYYDFVEKFEFVDGRAPISRSELTSANTWDIKEFFGKRDPRLRASIFYPESVYRGATVYFHSKTTWTENGVTKTSTNANQIINYNGKSWPGAAQPRNIRSTCMLLRKKVDPNIVPAAGNQSGQDYYVFRLAEILLNHAEAAFYLNKPGEALTDINAIRQRAGMPVRTEATEDNIRLERQFELCFEDHRYWDLVRWRTAQSVMDGVRTMGLKFEYNLDSERYTITPIPAAFPEPNVRKFGPERYYLPFSQARLSDNPKLIQNPGY